ncbi:hypothetical protein K439DRAFT_1618467 [Ramaria rubella]|nr:hypothetical protein K439DRAFT_1618467 [Ramaria rubella]
MPTTTRTQAVLRVDAELEKGIEEKGEGEDGEVVTRTTPLRARTSLVAPTIAPPHRRTCTPSPSRVPLTAPPAHPRRTLLLSQGNAPILTNLVNIHPMTPPVSALTWDGLCIMDLCLCGPIDVPSLFLQDSID